MTVEKDHGRRDNHGQDGHATSELGGWAGAPAEATAAWFEKRMEHLRVIEVRGKSLPDVVTLADGSMIITSQGTVPRRAHFTCASCGREGNTLESVRPTGHTAPVAAYTLQCHCPQCEAEGYTYGGRYFKAPDEYDIKRLVESEKEWASRMEDELAEYWPRSILPYAWKTSHWGIQEHGYTHWWKMFNPRQLLVHAHLLKAITEAPEDAWPLDVREQVLGAFQQYLRNQNMFSFWNQTADKMEPMMSNANYHRKMQAIENCVFASLGRGNWQSSAVKCVEGMDWARTPWELVVTIVEKAKSEKGFPEDPIIPGNEPFCGSSTDLSMLSNEQFELVITDPPFGDNVNYADLADFFYVWLRLPLHKWYAGLSEAAYFEPEFTPKSLEAIDNKAEHPDDRENYEKKPYITLEELAEIEKKLGVRDA